MSPKDASCRRRDSDCVPAWLQQVRKVKGDSKDQQGTAAEPTSHAKSLQADEIPTPCRKAGSMRLQSNLRAGLEHRLLSPGSDAESHATVPASPHAPVTPSAAVVPSAADTALPAPSSVPTAKESSTPSTAPATPTASPSPPAAARSDLATAHVRAMPQREAEASQCSDALEPLAAPVESLEVPTAALAALSPDGESPERVPSAGKQADRLCHGASESPSSCSGEKEDDHEACERDAEAEVKDAEVHPELVDGLSQFCFAKTTQEEAEAKERREAASPASEREPDADPTASAGPLIDLSQFAFAKTTQEERASSRSEKASENRTQEPAASGEAGSGALEPWSLEDLLPVRRSLGPVRRPRRVRV